jgi:hypothetical protein
MGRQTGSTSLLTFTPNGLMAIHKKYSAIVLFEDRVNLPEKKMLLINGTGGTNHTLLHRPYERVNCNNKSGSDACCQPSRIYITRVRSSYHCAACCCNKGLID